MRTSLVKKITLLVVASVFVLFVSELAVRWAFPDWEPRTGHLTRFWRFDPDYGWAHIPGASGRFKSSGFDTQVDINSVGFRGPEPLERKDPSRSRVVVMGDSFVWGFGVEQDEMFTSRLQALCESLDVINLGVSGYSTDQELLLFRERGAPLGPDVAVLLVVPNDFPANLRTRVYVYYEKPVFELEGDSLILTNRPVRKPNMLVRASGALAKRSYILKRVNDLKDAATWRRATRSAASGDQGGTHGASSSFPRTPADRVTVTLVRQFIASARAVNARPIILLGEHLGDRGRELSRALGDSGVDFVYLDEFVDPSEIERYQLPGDYHWNAVGHDVVARALLDVLASSDALGAEADRCDP